VLSHGVGALLSAGVPRVVVVTGAHPGEVRAALGVPDERVSVVDNLDWQEGQLSSLQCGLNVVDDEALEAVLVTLADVPLVAPATIRSVIDAWRETRAPIVRPTSGDTHGHPVLFDRRLFAELRAADRARGAKVVVRAHADDIVNVTVDDEGAFLDLDTPDDYARALALAARLSIGD
jgi:molybdenum cofactor cytidylyltransferase